VGKALDDVLVAYEMNGEPLPPDHGFPARLVVPSWIGIASIKWLGAIEVSATPLASPWNTQFYRLFDASGQGGPPIGRQVVKSAFELPWNASFASGRGYRLRGRSWSGNGRVTRVDVSVDGGATGRRARRRGPARPDDWLEWEVPWRPETAGPAVLLARATDETGATQPDRTPYNTLGYLDDAVARHPETVT
jgi:DMSO/TMAO reductase YedYZ molybdopterin-dependent catalytic subunit